MHNSLKYFLTGIRINKVIQFLAYSDIVMLSGWGLINPIIAVFFTEQIVGGDIALAGLAATTYFLVKSLLQVPVARFIDLRPGEWDDYMVMALGAVIYTVCAFLYIGVYLPWHVFAVQILFGVGSALYYPAWLAIFTRHTDDNQEGLEWSLYFTGSDLASALTAGFGGLLVAYFGYQTVFLIVGVASLVGMVFLLSIGRDMKVRHIARHRAKLAASSN
jgi:DHA1 family quinolone resistance protein-like MFS transporter